MRNITVDQKGKTERREGERKGRKEGAREDCRKDPRKEEKKEEIKKDRKESFIPCIKNFLGLYCYFLYKKSQLAKEYLPLMQLNRYSPVIRTF